MKFFIWFFLIISGCYPYSEPTEIDFDYICRLQPVIITKDGHSLWNQAMIDIRTSELSVYSITSLGFEILPIEYVESANLFDLTDDYFPELSKLCKTYSEEKGTLAVCFVNLIIYGGGKLVGGIAYYPSDYYTQYGIAISVLSPLSTVAHEIGHGLGNLDHIWEHDKIKDVPSNGESDCSSYIQQCNVMSDCVGSRTRHSCNGLALSQEQIESIRTWISCSPRNEVVYQVEK